MAERETREQAQERILTLQAELMERLEKNPKYQELDDYWKGRLVQNLMPQLYDPKYQISERLHSIQVSKKLIAQLNAIAIRTPDSSDLCADLIGAERYSIRNDLKEIKSIQKGEFEWVS